MTRALSVPIFAAALLASAPAVAGGQDAVPVVIAPGADSLVWAACPPIFPEGCELAVLHGDPSRPNADLLLRVQPGIRLPAHTHSSVERMILTEGRMSVKYEGAPETVLEPGAYAWGPANVAHQAACISDTPCLLFIAFEAPVDAMPHAGALR